MLAFGAVIDLSLAPPASELTARLRRALPAIPGRVFLSADREVALAHLADKRVLPFDAELPLRIGSLLVAGTLRIDAQEALRAALSPEAPEALVAASDARLVAYAYRRWGDRLAEQLIGDYAFVVWDRDNRRLVCARDPHGNRQLFWGRAGFRVAVGSTIDVVRALEGVTSDLHEPALVDFLRDGSMVDPERTVFRDVRSVPAAHTLVFDGESAAVLRRHWAFPVPTAIRYRREDEYVEHFTEVLHAAMRDRLRSETAAIYLSGGMDSTTLAVSAQRAAPGVALRAFTMTYPTLVPSDEDMLSAAVAARLGLAHEVLAMDQPGALSYLDDMDSLPSQPVDEPDLALARQTLVPLAAFAPIAIFGEDGDWLLQAPTLLTQLRTQPLAEVIGSWSRYWWRTGRRPWVGLEWRDHLRRWRHGGDPDRTPWMRADARGSTRTAPVPSSGHPLRPRNVRALSSPLWDYLYESLAPATTLQPLLHTLPLMDARVIAFVFALPPVPWCQEKYLLRTAMRGALPAAVLQRPKTALTGILEARVAQWRASGGADTPISDRVAPWVDVDAVRRAFRSGTTDEVTDAWRVLQLDRWLAREDARRA